MARSKSSSHLADGEVGTYALVPIGNRLTHIRGQATQAAFGPEVGIHKNTLGTYERGEREIGALSLAAYVGKGWNANWVLTGEGPERLEPAFQSHSQDLSEAHLNIALEYTDDIIRATRTTYVPRSHYAKLLWLMYQGVSQGLPVADIYEIGQQAVRAASSGTGEQGNDGRSGLDGPGTGSR